MVRQLSIISTGVVLCVGVLLNGFNQTAVTRSTVAPSQELEILFEKCGPFEGVDHLDTGLYREVLGADEILYKRLGGAREFEVYIAAWKPGNPYAFEAVRHPPDLCWSNVGWVCLDAISDRRIDSFLCEAEWRKFSSSSGSVTQEVLFWCILNGKPMHLGRQIPIGERRGGEVVEGAEFIRYWASFFSNSINSRVANAARVSNVRRTSDTFFVRINSGHPMSSITGDERFIRLLPLFAHVGITGGGMPERRDSSNLEQGSPPTNAERVPLESAAIKR